MTEHEKLKAISDKIDYKIPEYIWDYNGELVKPQDYGDGGVAVIDAREIIFTTEFMGKLMEYHRDNIITDALYEDRLLGLLDNLDNIVDYIYNLIF